MGTTIDRKSAFIRQLAVYLAGNQAEMSIRLQMGRADAQAWAALRDETPLRGYPTVDEAEAQLREWLLKSAEAGER